MRLGIDFGTTRTVVAAADRGNYPVVGFQSETGDVQQWYPSLVAGHGPELVFALDAQVKQQEPGWVCLRSMKRLLADVGPESMLTVGGQEIPALELLTQYLAQLRRDLYERSNLELTPHEPLEALIAVPANANSNQRFLTLEGFRRAGFRVLGLINEPSAAGVEYAHRYALKDVTGRKEYLIVYDLGGGTFDASIIGMKDRHHEVLTDEGIGQLGGDDFDELLMELVLAHAPGVGALTETARFKLLEECRQQKEGLHPNTRKIAIDLGQAMEGAAEVIVPIDEFYARCVQLVEKTIAALETAMRRTSIDWAEVAAIYLVGGSSDLPIVGRMLRERYGRRVRRSPYPYAATAIGLAAAADVKAGYKLQERFTRYFGVWREAENGRRIAFDPIFFKDTPLPGAADPQLIFTRVYQPVHNVGHFRYLECTQVDDEAQPSGDLKPWNEIYFPFDAALQDHSMLHQVAVARMTNGTPPLIQERYMCDQHGIIEVTIANHTAGYQRMYRLRELPDKRRTKRKAVGQGGSL